MTLEKFLENINKLVKENPEILDYEVIYARDDEGNGYQEVAFEPSIGIFDDESRGEFICESHVEDYERDKSEINSICIN